MDIEKITFIIGIILLVLITTIFYYEYTSDKCSTICKNRLSKIDWKGKCYCGYLFANGTIKWYGG